jgi:hypothetical protein
VLRKIFPTVLKVIGIVIIIGLGVSWFALLAGMAYGSPYLDFVVPGRNLFSYLGAFNLFMIIGIPLFVIVLTILRVFFRTRLSKRWRTALGIFWGINIAGLFLSAALVGKEFEFDAEVTVVQTELEVTTDTLALDMFSKEYKTLFGLDDEDVKLTENELVFDNVTVSIQRGDGPNFEMIQVNEARGVSSQKAHESAENIDFDYRMEGDKLLLPKYLEVTKDEKFRVQGVTVTVLIPEGKFVKISRAVAHNHGHVQKKDSEYYIWSSDNNIWKMEHEGLVCTDCE